MIESGPVTAAKPSARYREAMAILGRRSSPEEVRRASGLLRSASDEGLAEASEKYALIAAMGMIKAPDWPEALEYLSRAAGQGSLLAAQQLSLLADPEADLPSRLGGAEMAEQAASIDLAGRTTVPARRTLSNSPFLRVYERFCSPPECRFLIALSQNRLVRAPVYDRDDGRQVLAGARDNSAALYQLADMELFIEVIRMRIANACRLPIPFFEPPQILHYAVGERFKPHHDYLDPANPAYNDELRRSGQRVATFLIYLNEDFDGGETDFPDAGIRYRGRTGDALLIANVGRDGGPDPATRHSGLATSRGEKWLFSQWVRDRAPVA